MKLRSHIFLEGADGSGKSTLFQLLEQRGFPMGSHNGGPPKSQEDAKERLARIQSGMNNKRVWDRCLAISDQVYRFVLREPFNLPPHYLMWWLVEVQPVVVYCRPPMERILSQPVIEKPHKPAEHVDKVRAARMGIVHDYDQLMLFLGGDLGLTVIEYSFEIDPCAASLIKYLTARRILCVD